MELNIDRYGALIVSKRGIEYGLVFINLEATNRIDASIEVEKEFDITDPIIVSPSDANNIISLLSDFLEGNNVKYGLFDNDKPASEVGFPNFEGLGWTEHEFNSLYECREYAKKWLGIYGTGIVLSPGVPYDYDGCGDMIEIKKMEG